MPGDPERKKSGPKRSDSELVQLYLRTRESAYFTMLYRRYSTKVFSKCISLLRDEGQAQDATQDIFIKVYTNLAKFSERSKFSTWLYSVTYNYCIDYIRRKKKLKNVFSDEMESAPDMVEEVDDSELLEIEVERLKVILDRIPPGDKAVLLMKYQDDMSIRDIAEGLDKTESAIKMKLKRAKHKALLVYEGLYKKNSVL